MLKELEAANTMLKNGFISQTEYDSMKEVLLKRFG